MMAVSWLCHGFPLHLLPLVLFLPLLPGVPPRLLPCSFDIHDASLLATVTMLWLDRVKLTFPEEFSMCRVANSLLLHPACFQHPGTTTLL